MQKHLTKSNIPKEERNQYIILKKATDILKIIPENIPEIHRYCLDITPGIVKHMDETQLNAFTLEQIVYIPGPALAEFPEEILKKKKEESEDFEGSIEYKFSDRVNGKKVYGSEPVRPFEKIITALAQSDYRQKLSERSKPVRERLFEQDWEITNQIHSRDIGFMLGCSMRSAEKFLEDFRVPGTKHEFYYKDVLKVVAGFFVISKDVDPLLKKELKYLGYIKKFKNIKRLPTLLTHKDALSTLHVDLEEPSAQIIDKLEEICEQCGFVDLPINSRNSARFFRSTLDAFYDDPVFIEERARISALKADQ